MHGWHFLSAPVADQSVSAFHDHTSGNDFYKWDEAAPTNGWVNRKIDGGSLNAAFETAFMAGRGYLIANASASAPAFVGNINVSDVSVSGLANTSNASYPGWHLLGNPFACALSWNNGDWALSNINANSKIWDEANASYTTIEPNGIIPAMNGFMVYSDGDGSLTIPASARQHSSQNWYK